MKLKGKNVYCETEQEYNAVRAIAEAAGYPAWSGHVGWSGDGKYGVNFAGEFVLTPMGCGQVTFGQWIWQAEHKDTGEPVAPEWATELIGVKGDFYWRGEGKVRCVRRAFDYRYGTADAFSKAEAISIRPQEPKRLTVDDVIAEYPEWPGCDWIGFGFVSLTGEIMPYKKGSLIDKEEEGCYKICTREEYEARKTELAQVDNSWYERGELPPKGARVDIVGYVVYGEGETNCEVVEIIPSESVAVVRMSFGLGCFAVGNMKPVQTERELLIEQAKEVAEKWDDSCGKSIPELFVDAGWRPQED